MALHEGLAAAPASVRPFLFDGAAGRGAFSARRKCDPVRSTPGAIVPLSAFRRDCSRECVGASVLRLLRLFFALAVIVRFGLGPCPEPRRAFAIFALDLPASTRGARVRGDRLRAPRAASRMRARRNLPPPCLALPASAFDGIPCSSRMAAIAFPPFLRVPDLLGGPPFFFRLELGARRLPSRGAARFSLFRGRALFLRPLLATLLWGLDAPAAAPLGLSALEAALGFPPAARSLGFFRPAAPQLAFDEGGSGGRAPKVIGDGGR